MGSLKLKANFAFTKVTHCFSFRNKTRKYLPPKLDMFLCYCTFPKFLDDQGLHCLHFCLHLCIMRISPCNEDPLTSHFHIVKLGFTGVYIIFFFALKHRLWVLVRTASVRRF